MIKLVPVLALLAALGLSGCGNQCNGLSSTARDKEAVQNGYEVEREGSRGAECELQPNGSWQVDD